jgi:hypothetical protein
MNRLACLLIAFLMFGITHSYGEDYSRPYADTPSFNILPGNSISKAFKTFGKSKTFETNLAHDYVLYFDYEKQIGLIFATYKSAKTNICQITIRREQGKDAIKKLHELASLETWQPGRSKLDKPKNIKLPKKLTFKGLQLGLSSTEVERILKTKLAMNGDEASIHWGKTADNQIQDYGGMNFIFDNGKLISLSWYGVDP